MSRLLSAVMSVAGGYAVFSIGDEMMSVHMIAEVTLVGAGILGLAYSHFCYNMALQSKNLNQVELINKEKQTETSPVGSALYP